IRVLCSDSYQDAWRAYGVVVHCPRMIAELLCPRLNLSFARRVFQFGLDLDVLINGIDLLPDRFEFGDCHRRPDDPEFFNPGSLIEDVPTSLNRLIGRDPGGALIDGSGREENSV